MIPTAVQNQADIATKLMQGQISVGTVVPANTPTNPTPPAPPEGEDNWQHKYLVLQGKYNAEMSRLNAALAEKDGMISQLNHMVADLYQRIDATPPGDPGGSARPARTEKPAQQRTPRELRFEKVEEDELAGYGTEVQMMGRNMNAMVDTITELNNEVKTLRGQNVKSAWETFCEKMNALMPDWETINNDPAFSAWLSQKDGNAPISKHESLKTYAQQGDAQGALQYFKDFKEHILQSGVTETPSMSDIVQPQISGTPPQSPVTTGSQKLVSLAQYNKACQDYAHKFITYNQWKEIADAFQTGLKMAKGK